MSGKNCPHLDKMLPGELGNEVEPSIPKDIKCPRCGSQKLWRDGNRKIPTGEVQRYLCRVCWLRFSRW